jgi:hypothetical protein
MRVIRRLVQEQVVHDHAFHRRQAGRDMLGIGVGLQDILALAIQALERALDRRIQHVGMRRPGSLSILTPQRLSKIARTSSFFTWR